MEWTREHAGGDEKASGAQESKAKSRQNLGENDGRMIREMDLRWTISAIMCGWNRSESTE